MDRVRGFLCNFIGERFYLLLYRRIREGALCKICNDPRHEDTQCKQEHHLRNQSKLRFSVRDSHIPIFLTSYPTCDLL